MASHPHIFTIAAEKPFVDVLAAGLIERYGKENPLALAECLILLPTRRSCRALHEAFLRVSGGKPILLPRLRPIGDVSEDELMLAEWIESLLPESEDIAPAISRFHRLMALARLIREHHAGAVHSYNENIEQSARLAAQLSHFLDETLRERADLSQLDTLVPEEYAEHWQITTQFLKILRERWPAELQSLGFQEPLAKRNQLLGRLALAWRRNPPGHPVIAAGITGAVAITAEVMQQVARLENGMVVLPGLDLAAPESEWEQLGPTHPQYGLKRLLAQLGVERSDVALFDGKTIPDSTPPERIHLLRTALQPAEVTSGWKNVTLDARAALRNFSLIESDTPQEEAKVIALLMREALETHGKTAALVTHDRMLARMVAATMERFDVAVDDSAGIPLAATPAAVFLQLVIQAASERWSPLPLLSLLKHPLAACGMPAATLRMLTRRLEILTLHGVRPAHGLAALAISLEEALRHGEEVPDALFALLDWLGQTALALNQMMGRHSVPLAELIETHMRLAEILASTHDEDGGTRLWAGQDGQEVAEFAAQLAQATGGKASADSVDPQSYPSLFAAFLSGLQFRPRYGAHPRLHILSPIEARLQHYDLVILGSMNEGSWPPEPQADPWMNRAMRRDFGLPVSDRAIGEAAHDFYTIACAPEIVLSRASKSGGAPTEPSRWLLRLQALLQGRANGEDMRSNGPHLSWARALDDVERATPIARPEPRPPIAARPRSLSVTQIETLRRDPYGIYAREILKLKALAPLDQEPGAADYGSLIHRAMELFVRACPRELPEGDAAHALLLNCIRKAFHPLIDRPAVQTYWWPRFVAMADWIIAQERLRRLHGITCFAEMKASISFDTPLGPFRLRARLDRIELLADGSLALIDYKTGTLPNNYDIQEGFASQLPLGGWLLQKGQVEGFPHAARSVSALEYWQLGGGEYAGAIDDVVARSKLDAASLIAAAESQLVRLIAAYDDVDTPYTALPDPLNAPNYNDYEHLERQQEWEAF